MLVKLIQGEVPELEEAEDVLFKDLPIGKGKTAVENDLETLIAANVNLLESLDDDEETDTLLIIGRQVRTNTNKRMDLVALDASGALQLIEVKRDAVDVKHRIDNAEIQSVRYAASLARLRTVDQLVVSLYAPYVAKFQAAELAEQGGSRSAEEWARKQLIDFIERNEIRREQLNHAQRIVLVGAGFDPDTKSAAAWMAANGIPLRLVEIRPCRMGKTYFLDVQQVIPVPSYEDFYVDVTTPQSGSAPQGGRRRTDQAVRRFRPRLPELIAAGKVTPGDAIYFRGQPEVRATVTKDAKCQFEGKKMGIHPWAKARSGWASVNIYQWVMHEPSGKLLEDLRAEYEAEKEAAESIATGLPDGPPSPAQTDTASEQ